MPHTQNLGMKEELPCLDLHRVKLLEGSHKVLVQILGKPTLDVKLGQL